MCESLIQVVGTHKNIPPQKNNYNCFSLKQKARSHCLRVSPSRRPGERAPNREVENEHLTKYLSLNCLIFNKNDK